MPQSPTHDRAVLKQANGELQEDVVHKRSLDRATTTDADTETAAQEAASRGHGAAVPGDVVDRGPVEEVQERSDPADPVPRSLPR